jgi:hypothetical protein
VLALTLGELELSIKIVRNGDEFIFDEGSYQNYMVAEVMFAGMSLPL